MNSNRVFEEQEGLEVPEDLQQYSLNPQIKNISIYIYIYIYVQTHSWLREGKKIIKKIETKLSEVSKSLRLVRYLIVMIYLLML